MRHYIGRQCVVTQYGYYGAGKYGVEDCKILVQGEPMERTAGLKCLVPIKPPAPKQRRTLKQRRTPKREKVFA
jgi:hypothetical protein